LLEWVPDLQLDISLPSRSVPRSRSYANVVFEPSTSLQAEFTSFDEEGNKVWEPDRKQLVSFDQLLYMITTDGFEFAPNEFVTSLECVTLETFSTETGNKEFIAVRTTIDRGGDLAVKDAVSLTVDAVVLVTILQQLLPT